MEKTASATIKEYLSSIVDPRIEKKTSHKLLDIIVLTICGVICGANSWTKIETYGKAKDCKTLLNQTKTLQPFPQQPQAS